MALTLALGACVGSVEDAANPADQSLVPPGEGPTPTTSPPPNGPGPAACSGVPTPPRIWRLSDEQFAKAIGTLLPGVKVPPITTPGRSNAEFVNVAELYPVSGALAVDLRTAAKAVASGAVANLATHLGCAPGQAERACAEAFVDRFATRAFRRPLEPADRAAFLKLYGIGAEKSVADGVRLVIEAVLQSPSFLYRTELGAGGPAGKRVDLGSYELASALSFFFLDTIPDEGLWQSAQDGSLSTPAGYRRQVDRLLAEPRVRDTLGNVFLKWIGLGAGVTTELPSEQFPSYDDALRASLLEESRRFFVDLLSRGGTISDLLTSRRSFVDQRLAMLYGIPYSGKGDFVEVMLPAQQRAGVLTQAGFVVSKSRGDAVVHRGKWVREEILCGIIPEPPPGALGELSGLEGLTARQIANKRMTHTTCGACHQLMDNLGLTFENYDSLARYVDKDEAGKAVDASGEIKGTDAAGTVGNIRELAQRLAASRDARLCIEGKMLGYALGREAGSWIDRCEQQRIDDAVMASGGRLLDLMGAIALSAGFRTRQGGAQ